MPPGRARELMPRIAGISGTLAWIAIILLGVVGCTTPTRHEFGEIHMGTRVRMVIYADDRSAAEAAALAAFQRIEEVEQALSDYRPQSESSRLARQVGEPVRVSTDLFSALELSHELSDATNGAFDVTVGPMVQLWRRAIRQGELPRPRRLADAQARVGIANLDLDPHRRSVTIRIPGMALDFGGLGKGLAADQALEVLRLHGLRSALVDAGGDVVVGDAPPGRAGWRVMLPPIDPRSIPSLPGPDSGIPILLLENCAVATSGAAYQFLDVDGVRYSHVIDPRTGLGVIVPQGEIHAVTVVAPTGAVADGLASALSVLGPPQRSGPPEHAEPPPSDPGGAKTTIEDILSAFPGASARFTWSRDGVAKSSTSLEFPSVVHGRIQ